jgi:hypothetical protein
MAEVIFIPAPGGGSSSALVLSETVAAEDFDFVAGVIQQVQGDVAGDPITGLAPFEPSDGAVFGFMVDPPGPGTELHVNFNGSTLYGLLPVAPYVCGDDTVPTAVLFRFSSAKNCWVFATWADVAYSDLNGSACRVLYSTLDQGIRSQVIAPKNIFGRLREDEDVKGMDRSEVMSLVSSEMRNVAPIATAQSPYLASEGESVRFDASDPAGGTIRLPAPAIDSRNVTVSAKEVGGGSGTWVFDGDGKLIDGQATREIGSASGAYRAMEVRWDRQGDQWRVFYSYAGDLA